MNILYEYLRFDHLRYEYKILYLKRSNLYIKNINNSEAKDN